MTLSEIREKVRADPLLHEAWDAVVPLFREFVMAEQQDFASRTNATYEDVGRYTKFSSEISSKVAALVPPRKSTQKSQAPRHPALNPLPLPD